MITMLNAVIFHGTGCTPESYWFPSLKLFLEKRGYHVWVPQLPEADKPDLQKWLPKALEAKYSEETVVIGHSAGAPLVLSVLEKIQVRVQKAILVAGYLNDPQSKVLQPKYDWTKIKQNVQDIVIINSDNDPWGCDDKQGLELWKHLGGTLILREGEGHMGSDSFHQPYRHFTLLEKLLELSVTRAVINGSDKE